MHMVLITNGSIKQRRRILSIAITSTKCKIVKSTSTTMIKITTKARRRETKKAKAMILYI